MTHRKTAAFVKRTGAWVHGDRGVPEVSHHLHLAGIIPNIGTDDAEGACHPLHFAYCFWLIGNEIYYKARHCCMTYIVPEIALATRDDILGILDLQEQNLLGRGGLLS